jgi:hypothetical protein
MWSQVYNLDVRFPYELHLHGLSDLQIGSTSCSLKVIQQRIDEIVDDPVDSAVVIAGDIEDEDRPSTRSLRKATFADRVEVIERDAQKHIAYLDKIVMPMLLPLQKTKYGIMGILAGHHWTALTPNLSSAEYICNRLTELSGKTVHYLGEMSAFLDLRFRHTKGGDHGKSIRRVVHVQHGEGSGQTKASSLAKLDRTSQGFQADVYIRAHDCQLVASKTDVLYPKMVEAGSHPDVAAKTVTMVNLGSATRGYEMNRGVASYIESKMMRPTTLGWATVKFLIRKEKVYENPQMSYNCFTKVEF